MRDPAAVALEPGGDDRGRLRGQPRGRGRAGEAGRARWHRAGLTRRRSSARGRRRDGRRPRPAGVVRARRRDGGRRGLDAVLLAVLLLRRGSGVGGRGGGRRLRSVLIRLLAVVAGPAGRASAGPCLPWPGGRGRSRAGRAIGGGGGRRGPGGSRGGRGRARAGRGGYCGRRGARDLRRPLRRRWNSGRLPGRAGGSRLRDGLAGVGLGWGCATTRCGDGRGWCAPVRAPPTRGAASRPAPARSRGRT